MAYSKPSEQDDDSLVGFAYYIVDRLRVRESRTNKLTNSSN